METHELINETVWKNRCAGCALENLDPGHYFKFNTGSVYMMYVFCSACAGGYLKKVPINQNWTPVSYNDAMVVMVMKS